MVDLAEAKEGSMSEDVRIRLAADSEAELQEDIERYKRSYPFVGYDTRVMQTFTDEKGKYVAIMSRMSSCD